MISVMKKWIPNSKDSRININAIIHLINYDLSTRRSKSRSNCNFGFMWRIWRSRRKATNLLTTYSSRVPSTSQMWPKHKMISPNLSLKSMMNAFKRQRRQAQMTEYSLSVRFILQVPYLTHFVWGISRPENRRSMTLSWGKEWTSNISSSWDNTIQTRITT